MDAQEKTWADWITYHCNIFGFISPREVEMVTAWAAFFAEKGWKPYYLLWATKKMAGESPKSFRSEHVQLLSELVREELESHAKLQQTREENERYRQAAASMTREERMEMIRKAGWNRGRK